MKARIREYEPSDEEPVVGLSLRAWELVKAGYTALPAVRFFKAL